MPSFKLKGAKAEEVKSGFEAYDGPAPTRKGFYRAVLKKVAFGRNSKGSMGFNLVAELEAAPGDPKDHAIFDGYPMFIRSVITEGADGSALKEGAQRNLSNFLNALGTGDEPTVLLEDGDVEDGVAVKSIGKRNPVGAAVNIDMGFEDYQGESRPSANGIYKVKDEAASASKGKVSASEMADDEDDLLDEAEEAEAEETEEEDGGEYSERAAELETLKLPALKAIAKGLEVGISGTKDVLITRILDAEFATVLDEDEAEEAEEEEEADEVESEEEEAEEEEEEEADEDDEAYTARVEELAEFDRTALKKILKEVAPDFTILKRHTDDEIRTAITDVEFGDELPF